MTRREARELAFIILFEWTFSQRDVDEIIADAGACRDLIVDDFSVETAKNTVAHMEELDQIIDKHSQGWKLNRLSRVALSALRLALYEMNFAEEIPVSVSINEAVELVKKYATTEDASFVNGLLGGVAREVQKNNAEESHV